MLVGGGWAWMWPLECLLFVLTKMVGTGNTHLVVLLVGWPPQNGGWSFSRRTTDTGSGLRTWILGDVFHRASASVRSGDPSS